jgi:MFS family permease
MPNIGVAIFGIGGLVSYQGVQAYVLETYPRYAASAMAATTLARSVSGCVFPIFAPKMYQTLDYGRGNTLLVGVAIIFGLPAPVLLYFFGARLRARISIARMILPIYKKCTHPLES